MKKIAMLSLAVALALGGCNALNLTPQQQANLQNEILLGRIALRASANIICVFEPVTTALIGVFDTSKSGTTMNTKIDKATAIACDAILKATGP